jgi:hypothetical protein
MKRSLLIAVILSFAAAPAFAQGPTAAAPKLICTSVPGQIDPKTADGPSCDEICSAKGAVCTGLNTVGMSAPPTCESRGGGGAICRCCRIAP